MRRLLKTSTAWVTAAALLNPIGLTSAFAAVPVSEPTITLATTTTSVGNTQARPPANQTPLSTAQKIALLRQKVKYVFVLFQENRSFDHYFGTYPGANGLFSTYPGASPSDPSSQPANTFGSFNSVIRNVDGTYSTIQPFLNPRTIVNQSGATVQIYPEDMYSVDHSHAGYINDFHSDQATKSIPKNDGYPLDQQGLHYSTDASGTTAPIVNSSGAAPTSNPTLQTKQKGEAVIGHVDCDTIPFLWQYADRFVLFDNFHQTATGPSTPNAIALIGGQVGDTQWAKHPNEADPTGLTMPVVTDSIPFPGSTGDTWAGKPPFGSDDGNHSASPPPGTFTPNPTNQIPLTFASLPLSFMGSKIGTVIRADQHPATDLIDVQHDIQEIALQNPSVGWGWYQQGYGPEPFDGSSPAVYMNGTAHQPTTPLHQSLITHHVGPQYFGYLGDNATVSQHDADFTTPNKPGNMHGLQQFYTDVNNRALPANGGVFYVRGGYYNNDGLSVQDPNPAVQHAFPGNDDHGSYSDSQIAEALVADSVNAIANSPYWQDCAIIITYDESDGFYDHQPEQFRTYGPDGQPETGGPRIPAIVISPYAAAHAVSHVYSEHSAVIKFIDELFNLVPLGSLPDETAARNAGATAGGVFNAPNGNAQLNLGPADGPLYPNPSGVQETMGDLTEAFDNDRLLGNAPLLPASYAIIPQSAVTSLPHYVSNPVTGPFGCQTLSIVPTDYSGTYTIGGEIDPPPPDFNPRPTASPGSPYYNTSNNTTPGSTTGTGSPWPN
jgi:phospholipase C